MRHQSFVVLAMLALMNEDLNAVEQRSDSLRSQDERSVRVNFERQGMPRRCNAFSLDLRVGEQLIVGGIYSKQFFFTKSQSEATRQASSVTLRVRCGKQFWICRDLPLVLSPSIWTFGLDTRPYSHPHEREIDREFRAVWIKTVRVKPDNGLESTNFRWCAEAMPNDPQSVCRERWHEVSIKR